MLDRSDLELLASRCAAGALRWRPVLRADGVALLLEPAGRERPWQRLLLSPAEDEFELSTEAGETLARASDLNLVLDAVAGGVCEGSRRGRLAQSRALAVVV